MSAIFGSPSHQEQSSSSSSTNQSTNGAMNEASNGSMNQSNSGNLAYPMLSQLLGGQVSNGAQGSNDLAALLGIGGGGADAQNAAFKNWQNSTGYQFGLDQGAGAITGSAAARGLLNSGDTAKALDIYGQNYANTQYQNYLNPLMSLINGGTTAGGVIGGTGGVSNAYGASSGQSSGISGGQSTGNQTSTSTGQSTGAKPGIGGMLGQLAAGIATGGMSTLASAGAGAMAGGLGAM